MIVSGREGLGEIDAARGEEGEGGGETEGRASLLGALRGVGVGVEGGKKEEGKGKKEGGAGNLGKEEYERFQREMKGFL